MELQKELLGAAVYMSPENPTCNLLLQTLVTLCWMASAALVGISSMEPLEK